ncbi:MAG: phenylacetate--CoA ligase family protein [Gemmatimonadota bacterium]|nr:MAG: phenylacetate--CoA ligase family protein [Gemmatimonadota bacterium]
MHPAIALVTYKIVQYWRNERVFDALDDLEQSQWRPLESVRQRQWEKLKQLVRHAYDHVPHYRKMYDAAGFRPARLVTIEDLELIPPISKQVVRENARDLIAQDRRYKFSEDSTSGSSGPTTIIYTDRTALAYQHAAVFRAYRWMGLKVGERLIRFWGTQLDTKRRTKDSVKDLLLNRKTFSTHGLDRESLEMYYRELVRFNPASFYGFTSGIYEFAKFVKGNALPVDEVHLKAIIVTGEPLLSHQRQLIEEVFGCRVFNEYGCAEFGPVACECPKGALHIMAENVLVEVEAADDDASRERGNLIMTELNNFGMPMIRYRMGDVGVLADESCECGRGLPVLQEISGRMLDFVQTADGKKVHGMYFDYLPKYFIGEIHQFQIIQEDLQHITVRVVKDAGFNESTIARFEEKLRRALGNAVDLKYEIGDTPFREETGKHRLVVSRISEG